MEVHHIGYFVKDINKAAAFFNALGYRDVSSVFSDESRNVQMQLMEMSGYKLELVSFLDSSKKSPIDSFRKKNCMPYHICYYVCDMEQSIVKLKKEKYILIEPPSEAKALGEDMVVAFLYNKDIGIIELASKVT
jgi:methylmalonyl-CoA/ethylmalonyl-CoA epimerase